MSLVIGVAGAVALGGTLYAFAGWAPPPTAAVIRLHAVAMPPGNTPSVEKRATNALLRWVPNRLAPGVAAQSYVVTRHGHGGAVEVCRVTMAGCTEKNVPDGKWSWTVRPVFETWVGEDSAPTAVLTFGDGVAKPDALAPVLPDAALAAPMPVASSALSTAPTGTTPAPASPAKPPTTPTDSPTSPTPDVFPAPDQAESPSGDPAPAESALAPPSPDPAGQ
jgi:hypothetical protein